MIDLEAYRVKQTAEINQALDSLLPGESERPYVLHQAMRYSMFSGGRRLRPILCLAAAQAVGDYTLAMKPACAVEAMHTYSLIHDDLPALDDDKERRGKPSSHVVFGEAQAILAGDGLLTLAFEWAAEATPLPPYTVGDVCHELAAAGGAQGIVGGQVEDILAEGKEPSEERLLFIDECKTVAIIRAAVRLGGMCAGASASQLEALTVFANSFGLARQFIDDIEDAQEGEDSSDMRLKKMTAVTVYGLEGAKKRAADGMQLAIKTLESAQLTEAGREALVGIAKHFLKRL